MNIVSESLTLEEMTTALVLLGWEVHDHEPWSPMGTIVIHNGVTYVINKHGVVNVNTHPSMLEEAGVGLVGVPKKRIKMLYDYVVTTTGGMPYYLKGN